jgi:EmrB/QacA subfamily drug resistance transporter
MSSQASDGVSKGVALFVASMAAFMTPFMVSSLNVALPLIGREFSLSAVVLGWIPTVYLLAAAIFLIPIGRIADIYGRKRIFVYGIILYTIACLLLPFSNSAMMLIAFRVLEGIGAAAIFGTGVAILTSVFPVGERGKALGINVALVYAGLSFGPPIGGLLTQYLTWRSIFFVNVPLGLIVIFLVFWKMKGEWAEAKGEGFDLTGAAIYGLALAALITGFSFLPGVLGIGLVLGGVLGLLLFIRWEMGAKSPLLNIGLFRNNPVFTWSNVAALINYSATAAVAFLLSLYLQYIKGFTPEHAGLILVSQPIVMTALSPVAGRLSDRLEPQVVASIGMALTTVGLLALVFLSPNTGLWFILLSLVVLGVGFGLFSSPNTNAVMSSVNKRFYAVASGTVGTMRLLGQMSSLAIVVLLFALYIGRVEITPAYYPLFMSSQKTAFIIFAALCFGGIFASLARGKMRRQKQLT